MYNKMKKKSSSKHIFEAKLCTKFNEKCYVYNIFIILSQQIINNRLLLTITVGLKNSFIGGLNYN